MPIAFDIGSQYLKIVEGSVKKDSLLINSAVSVKLPYNFSSLSDNDKACAISKLAEPLLHRKVIRSSCYITTADNNFLIRDVDVPKGSTSEMRAMALNEMTVFYDIDRDNTAEIFVKGPAEDNKITVKCAIISSNLVKAYYTMIKGLGLRPAGFSFHSCGIERLIGLMPKINGASFGSGGFILLDVGASSCTMHLCINGAYVLSRSTQTGFSEVYGGSSGMPETYECPADGALFDIGPEQSENINGRIAEFITKLTDEINRVMGSLHIQYGQGADITDIYLFGGNVLFCGTLQKMIKASLGVRVSSIDDVSGIDFCGKGSLAPYLNAAVSLLPFKKGGKAPWR